MLIIELTPLPNGAHRNQSGAFIRPPDGWAVVPPALEREATGYLPFIDLTVEDGKIIGVAQGAIPEPEPVPPAPMTTEELALDLLTDLNYRTTLLELGMTT